jgi:drug/metabolite transporter (DMT)-like permease
MWGFTGILGKLIHLDSYILVWHRVFIALMGLVIYLVIKKTSIKIKSKKDLLTLCIVGIFVAMHWITFYKSIQLSTASLGILCLSTVTLHVSWLDPIIMKRKFSWLEFLFGLLVIVGIYIVSSDFSANDYEALIWGLSSALFAALFAVFNGKLVQTVSSPIITLYEMGIGLLFLTGILIFQGKFTTEALFTMTLSDLLWLLFLGLLCTSFAFLATIEVVKRLGAFTVSLSINLEPVYTILLAIIILNENELLGTKFYIGAVIIILVVLANGLVKNLMTKKHK